MEEIMLPAIHLAELSTLSTRAFNAFSSLSRAHSTLHHERAFHRLSEVAQQFVSGASEMPFIMKIPPSFRLTKVTQTDFAQALTTEPLVSRYFNTHEESSAISSMKKQWLQDTAHVVNQRISDMPSEDRGIELSFRFRKAYGDKMHHIALGTLWRGNGSGLQFGVVHQEAIPFKRNTETIHQSLILNHFDTGAYFRDARSPVQNSLEKYGPPDVMIRTCCHPENILVSQWLSSENCIHPYGYRGKQCEGGFHELSCFSVTRTFQKIVRGNEVCMDTRPHVPDMIKEVVTDLFGTESYEKLRQFEFKGRKIDIEDPLLSEKEFYYAFISATSRWGDNEKWDVSPITPAQETVGTDRLQLSR